MIKIVVCGVFSLWTFVTIKVLVGGIAIVFWRKSLGVHALLRSEFDRIVLGTGLEASVNRKERPDL